MMNEWQGKLTKSQVIQLLERMSKSEYCGAIDFKEPDNIPRRPESKGARIASSAQEIYDALVEVLGYQSLAPADVIRSAEDLIERIERK